MTETVTVIYDPIELVVISDDSSAEIVLVTDETIQVVEIAEQGLTGANGQSAYQIAVANGFVGTEAAWLASLSAGGVDIFNQVLDGGNFAYFIFFILLPLFSATLT